MDDEYSPQASAVVAYSTSKEGSELDSEYDSDPEIQTIYTSQPIIAPLTNLTPIAQVHFLLDTYSRPIPVIALFNTRAAATILHPKILLQEFWLLHHQMFKAVNGETFLITLKSKSILIRIFPTLTIKHQVHIPSEFLLKNPNPLWKNPKFFIYLPFKKNEDVNPTKASHRGMNLEHLALATQELSTLLAECLILPTTSPWACEAFYVNKHTEQVRGKLRLVINYQDLNHFLVDDKFPLPNKSALF